MIRPEVWEKLRRFAEPLVWIGLVLIWFGVVYSFRNAHWLVLGIPLVLAVLSGVGVVQALVRLRLAPDGQGRGVVLVDERRIGFFGTDEDGGFVDLDALLRLEIRGALPHKYWVLYHEDGPPLQISQNAPGADQLLDAFTALSGLGLAKFAAALGADGDDVHLLWEKPQPSARVFTH